MGVYVRCIVDRRAMFEQDKRNQGEMLGIISKSSAENCREAGGREGE